MNQLLLCAEPVRILDAARQLLQTVPAGTVFTSQELFTHFHVFGDKRGWRAGTLARLRAAGVIAPVGQVMETRASGSRGYTTRWVVV